MAVVADEQSQTLLVRRWSGASHTAALFQFGDDVLWRGSLPRGRWAVLLDSADRKWHGPGSGVPRDFDSDGAVSLSLARRQLVLLEMCGDAEGGTP